jgi:hypothetical protein
MALHRDIYWVGKQWAVTGHGIQACNQRQKGKFDIEAARLWEDGVQEAVRTQKWVNTDDFEKAVDVARKYYPEPPRQAPSPAKPAPPPPPEPALIPEAPLKLAPVKFDMQMAGLGARLVPVWRVRTRVAVRPDNR